MRSEAARRPGGALARAILIGLSGLLAACASPAPPGFTLAPQPATGPPASVAPATPAPSPPRPTPVPADVGVKEIATGLPAPDGLVGAPDGSGRLFVIDQTGKVLIIQDGVVLPQPFLDVSAKLPGLDADYDERGLLGLAFDPAFARTGRVFVYYTAKLRPGAPGGMDHTDVISSFTVGASDPNQVDPTSEKTI